MIFTTWHAACVCRFIKVHHNQVQELFILLVLITSLLTNVLVM